MDNLYLSSFSESFDGGKRLRSFVTLQLCDPRIDPTLDDVVMLDRYAWMYDHVVIRVNKANSSSTWHAIERYAKNITFDWI